MAHRGDGWTQSSHVLFPLLLVLLTGEVDVVHGRTPAPNFVVILTDDMAWSGTSVQMDPTRPDSKSDYYQTPNLESLAADGMVFSRAYASGPICSPTRAALQTGKSPAQLRVTDVRNGGKFANSRFRQFYNGKPLMAPIPRVTFVHPVERTLPQMLKSASPEYSASLFGKEDWRPNPRKQGYDFYVHNLPVNRDQEDPGDIFAISRQAMQFMENQVSADRPFFTLLAHYAPKLPFPYVATQESIDFFEGVPPGERHDNLEYAALTKDIDHSIGMVLDKIRALGIEDNTYVIFASDHGAATGVTGELANAPLTGGKGTLFEGALRIPLIIRGPGVAAGASSRVPVLLTDLYPTLYDLAGGKKKLPSQIEGTSIAPVLKNNGEIPGERTALVRAHAPAGELFFHSPHYGPELATGRIKPASAIIRGDFKLIRNYGENGAPDEYLLFHLANSLEETNDVDSPLNHAPQMPGKVQQLRARLDRWLDAVDACLPYDVRTPIELTWQGDAPGALAGAWRSVEDVGQFNREVWLPQENGGPRATPTKPFQPGLATSAFRFDGGKGFSRHAFRVSDGKASGPIDRDHAATFEIWVKVDRLDKPQILFESGSADQGLSLTLVDADGDDRADDAMLRLQSRTGVPLVLDAEISHFADPTRDFLQIVAVIRDSRRDRGLQLYVNGALAAEVDGSGRRGSLDWDGPHYASLGRIISGDPWGHFQGSGGGGDTLGGYSDATDLPQVGNLRGEIAEFGFLNEALSAAEIQTRYNAKLTPVDFGIIRAAGDALPPDQRPTNMTLNAADFDGLVGLHERNDMLDKPLKVDVKISGGAVLNENSRGGSGVIEANTAFSSYLLQFDPAGKQRGKPDTVRGSFQFEGPILGIIADNATLAKSDAVAGAIGNYGDHADRGMSFAPGDFLNVSSDRRNVDFALSTPAEKMLQFRVITELPGGGH